MITWAALKIVSNGLAKAYQRHNDAETDRQRIAADVDIKRLEAQRDALVNGHFNWIPKVVQALFALPFLIYLWKLIIWDKVMGWGTTDSLGQWELGIGATVISFYFLRQTCKDLIGTWRK